ncbi:pepsin/retropepsin-like aspartic protease family protein [Methanosarcina horonobensis]|uniref:hypothetical protein n=1 Tax=Methanosarcina horonobensis TaxID=418008 RepID=UPI000B0C7A1F|nr:hypothetical protein [Methanosarcina horonobensis]
MNKRETACAYLDTGSDAIVIPRDLWLRLGLQEEYRTFVSAVNSTVVGWYTFIDLEFFLETNIRMLKFFYNEVAGDMLIGRNVLDEYSVTFDGRNSKLYIE